MATHCIEQAGGGQSSETFRVPQMIWTLRVMLRKQRSWTWRLSLSTSEVVAAHPSAFLLPISLSAMIVTSQFISSHSERMR